MQGINDYTHHNAVNDVCEELCKASHRPTLVIARDRVMLHYRNAYQEHYNNAVEKSCEAKRHHTMGIFIRSKTPQ